MGTYFIGDIKNGSFQNILYAVVLQIDCPVFLIRKIINNFFLIIQYISYNLFLSAWHSQFTDIVLRKKSSFSLKLKSTANFLLQSFSLNFSNRFMTKNKGKIANFMQSITLLQMYQFFVHFSFRYVQITHLYEHSIN